MQETSRKQQVDLEPMEEELLFHEDLPELLDVTTLRQDAQFMQ